MSRTVKSGIPSSLSFLPVRLLQRLHGKDGVRPRAEVFPAAVLFVDVSRYTSLMEQNANRGREGIEQIAELLHRSYSRWASYVDGSGGEVAQFAGDSLVAYWLAEEGFDDALAAATACAKRVCGSDPPQVDSEILSCRAGIGTGMLWIAAVGGYRNHWNLIVGGPALRRATTAHAKAGARNFEILNAVSSDEKISMAEQEPQRTAIQKQASSRPDNSNPSPEWFTGFLPARFDPLLSSAVTLGLSNERDSGLAALTGWRPVTVLFLCLKGFDEAHLDALAVQRLCESLQSVVTSEEGPLGDLLIDDKGLIFHTVFGEPGKLHKDDSLRCLNAALGIVDALARFDATCSVGVASGEALFKAVGPPQRRVFMTLGPVMNRAARLMSAGSTGILCDSATERACRGGLFEFSYAGEFQLAGIGQMSAGFRPSRKPVTRVAVRNSGPIIGRKVEMERLLKVLDESGQPRLVIVTGEAGIGKSRLLEAFVDAARERRRPIAVVNIERGDRQRLLVPWRAVLETVLGEPRGDGAHLARCLRHRLKGHEFEHEFEQRLPLLAPMLSFAVEDTESTGHLDGANRADATMRFIIDVLEVLAPSGFVIVLEDSQWMDSASWRVSEWLVRRLPSLLLVMSVRQEEGPKEYRDLRRRIEETRFHSSDAEGDIVARAGDIVELDRLSDDAVREVVLRTIGGVSLTDELGTSLCAMARGNPLFAEEGALALHSEGLIASVNGRWSPITSMERGRLERFDAIERVVRERLDHLAPMLQNVLRAAAVIGRVFDARAVQVLLPNDSAEDIRDSLADLESRRLVTPVDGSGCIFQFRHDHMRDVIYDAIPGADKQELHRCFAVWLEESGRGQQRADLATLVRHWDAGGNVHKAVSYADAAATDVLRSGSFREAEEFLALCIAHTRSGDAFPRIQRIRWQRALAEAHYGRGNLSAQGESVTTALTLAGRFLPRARLFLVGRFGLELVRTAAQQFWPWLFVRSKSADQRLLHLELARCYSLAALFYYFNQDLVRGVLSSFSAVNAIDHCGPGPDLVRAYAQTGCGLGIGGYSRLADHFLGKAERVAEREGDPTGLANALFLGALYRVGHGAWGAVQERIDRSQELSTAAGDHVTWCNAQAVRFWMHSYRGQREEAEQTAELLLARAQSSGNIQQEIWALRCKALCALAADRPRHAANLLRMALATLPKSSDVAELIASRGCLALALTRCGDHRAGVQEAVSTCELFKRRNIPTVHSILDGSSAVAEVFLRGRQEGLSRDYPEWNHWETTTLRELDRHRRAFPVASARYGLWSGLALWLDGRRHNAIQTWREALKVAQSMGLHQDESLIAAELRHREDE